jgi:colanic acid biosynthesis glycosyl transferase WcaI
MKAILQAKFGRFANIDFLPLQPVERLDELLALANLHVLPQLKGAADLVLPSKLGGMLASGRPIVATVEPDTELFQILSGVALLTPAGDAAALASAIGAAETANLSQNIAEGLRLAESLSSEHLLPLFEQTLLGNGALFGDGAARVEILAKAA